MESGRRRKPKNLSKKQKFIKDGVFYAELNDLLAKELAEQGYAGCDVRVTPKKTEIIIHANKTMKVVGDDGRRARELTKLIEKRFMFEPGTIKIFAQRIKNRGLSALSQAEAVRFRLFEGLSVRRACYSVLKWIMDRGAKGCEVVVSGKLRGQRAKSMKFREGYMIHAGDATNYYIDTAIKHVHLRQGVLGIKVKIMLPHKNDDSGRGGRDGGQNQGVEKQLPDTVKIRDPKDVDPDRMEHETAKMNAQRGLPNFNQNNFNQQRQTMDNQNNFNNQQDTNQQTFDPNQQSFQQPQQQDIQGQMDPNMLQQQQQQQQQMEQQYNNQYQQQQFQPQNQQFQPQYDPNQQQQQQQSGGFQQYQ